MKMSKVLARYACTHSPFDKDVVVDDHFTTDDFTQAKERLVACLDARSNAAIYGESGTGKTNLGRAVEESLPRGSYDVRYLANSTLPVRDFYRQLSVALGLEPRANASMLFHQVSRHFAELAGTQRLRPVLILDEAHLLPLSVLSQLHILLNFERDSKSWLSLVLVGLTDLKPILARGVLASLSARIPVRIHVKPLDPAGVREYIVHRMAKAGARTQVFSEDAMQLLAQASGGVMRKLDTLATQTLIEGLSSKGAVVDHAAVARAIEICKEVL
jgi:type II secretory pathway predicted ATPase ExeA